MTALTYEGRRPAFVSGNWHVDFKGRDVCIDRFVLDVERDEDPNASIRKGRIVVDTRVPIKTSWWYAEKPSYDALCRRINVENFNEIKDLSDERVAKVLAEMRFEEWYEQQNSEIQSKFPRADLIGEKLEDWVLVRLEEEMQNGHRKSSTIRKKIRAEYFPFYKYDDPSRLPDKMIRKILAAGSFIDGRWAGDFREERGLIVVHFDNFMGTRYPPHVIFTGALHREASDQKELLLYRNGDTKPGREYICRAEDEFTGVAYTLVRAHQIAEMGELVPLYNALDRPIPRDMALQEKGTCSFTPIFLK